MNDDLWGPWIEHDGKGCPVKGMWVQLFDEGPTSLEPWEGLAGSEFDGTEHITGSSWHWAVVESHWGAVIRYRVRRPKALQQLIQMVENLPAHKPTYEDA